MKRIACAALLTFLAVTVLGVRALGKDDPGGDWTVNIFEGGKRITFWLVHLENKAGKLAGIAEPGKGVPETTVSDVHVQDGLLEFALNLRGNSFHFQGKLPPVDGKKIQGSMARASMMVPVVLERTSPRDFRSAETTKEIAPNLPKDLDLKALTSLGDSPLVFELAGAMLRSATAKKAKLDLVRSWYELVAKKAAEYGPRWQRETALRSAETLAAQKAYAGLAEQAAQQALTGTKGDFQLRAMTALVTALRNEGSPEYAKDAAALEKLERSAYREHEKEPAPFSPEKYVGRKGKSDRAVLVELFTGAMCPPCVAADLAFDGLAKAYTPKEVVLLQYHEHIPGPDPLTNADTEARLSYYGDAVAGTPTIIFNGRPTEASGGAREDAKEKFAEYCKVIDPLLERPAAVKLQAEAVRTEDKIRITATVSGVEKPGEKMRLRMALVEEWARYPGGNGITYHHHVVRYMPGAPKGWALTREADRQEVTVDLNQVRERLSNYLEDFSNKARPFHGSWPLTLYDLRAVAFVQNDDSKEVLQAVEVPIRGEGRK